MLSQVEETLGQLNWSARYTLNLAQGNGSEIFPDPEITLGITETSVLAELHSPGELRVYDSEGHITGLVNGEAKNEIPYSDCYENAVTILSPSDSYRYEVAGTSEGSYKLTVSFVTKEKTNLFTATDIPTSGNAIHRYTIDCDALSQGEKGVTVQIDSDGDGTFEKSITSDSELTQDEFASATSEGGEGKIAGLPFWIWIAIGVVVILVVGIVFGRRLARR